MLKRSDIIQRLADMGYTKKDAAFILDDFIHMLTIALCNGESLSFHGFGSFEVREMSERESVDCRTGERILIPRFKAPKFVPSKRLRRIVRDGCMED